jgi:hypothetical protein
LQFFVFFKICCHFNFSKISEIPISIVTEARFSTFVVGVANKLGRKSDGKVADMPFGHSAMELHAGGNINIGAVESAGLKDGSSCQFMPFGVS